MMKSFFTVRALYRGGYVTRFVKIVRPCYAVAITAAVILAAVILGVLL